MPVSCICVQCNNVELTWKQVNTEGKQNLLSLKPVFQMV